MESEEELLCTSQLNFEFNLIVPSLSFFFPRIISREALNFLIVNSHTLLGLIFRS